ncbi:hypothetical protein [Burkholderia sp. B21-005]|uniref:hypothetical protein n=1 Tax=Burkholderia sp. B21-005 TaxID=2890406 RepID=UPI001E3D30A1|nr:hypothetical protein [Burkholderia sp. B21-005]UEP42715.1 hypothetical protein LMA02_07105 [Burkholderia sp. B21-005]
MSTCSQCQGHGQLGDALCESYTCDVCGGSGYAHDAPRAHVRVATPEDARQEELRSEYLRGVEDGRKQVAREYAARTPRTDVAGAVAGECFIVIGHGESDIPEAKIVTRRDDLLDAVLGMIYGSASDATGDLRAMYAQDLDDDDQWAADTWSCSFEIGGIVVWHVGLHPFAPQPPSADAAAAPADERAVATFEEWLSSLSPQRRALIGDARDARMGWEAARAAASQPAAVVEQLQTMLSGERGQIEIWKQCAKEWCDKYHELEAAMHQTVDDEPAAAAGQETVGCLTVSRFRGLVNTDFDYYGSLSDGSYEVYTAPPAQVATRQGLTDGEREAIEFAVKWFDQSVLPDTPYAGYSKVLRALLEGAKNE